MLTWYKPDFWEQAVSSQYIRFSNSCLFKCSRLHSNLCANNKYLLILSFKKGGGGFIKSACKVSFQIQNQILESRDNNYFFISSISTGLLFPCNEPVGYHNYFQNCKNCADFSVSHHQGILDMVA